jgi:glycosyltransferase involved in cell wall biosynthesis
MSEISVIIPLYNKGKYIARALDSVFAQTFEDFEVIVVNDGSMDDGPDIVRTYHDPRLRMIQQANAGPGAARNRGIRESTAPFLTFLDADDEWLPEFLEKYLCKLKNNPECDLVAGTYFYGPGKKDNKAEIQKHGIKEGPWQLPDNVSYTDLHNYLTMPNTCTIMCKRYAVNKYGGFYSDGKCTRGEDRYLQLQLLFNHKIYRMMEPLMWYHTETLGISAIEGETKALAPILTDPEPIRANCPEVYREALELYLASLALNYAHEYINTNGRSSAVYLVQHFPLMKKWFWKYIKLKIKIIFPALNTIIRKYKLRTSEAGND